MCSSLLGLLRAAVFLMSEAFLPHPAHVCSSLRPTSFPSSPCTRTIPTCTWSFHPSRPNSKYQTQTADLEKMISSHTVPPRALSSEPGFSHSPYFPDPAPPSPLPGTMHVQIPASFLEFLCTCPSPYIHPARPLWDQWRLRSLCSGREQHNWIKGCSRGCNDAGIWLLISCCGASFPGPS